MFVLQPEVVPDEATEYLQRAKNWDDNLPINVTHLDQTHRERPSKAQNEILNDGKIVEPLKFKIKWVISIGNTYRDFQGFS